MSQALTPEIRALIDAANAGDTDAFLAAFTPHLGLVDDWGRRFDGADAIRGWSDAEFIGRNVSLNVVHFYALDETEVVVIANVGGDGFNGPSTFSFRVADNKVTEMRITA
ncbi:nuclear transport factor 2 family protein [Mycobacterium sp. NPDC003323]